jgi:cytochrome c peroxidase
MSWRGKNLMGLAAFVVVSGLALVFAPSVFAAETDLGPLPALKVDEKKAELGKLLFFDKRLSGDAARACNECHDPKKGYGDGRALSEGYPGTLHWRNAQTLLNAAHQKDLHWPGSQGDLDTSIRTHVTGWILMNDDGRALEERMILVPEYRNRFKDVYKINRHPMFGQIMGALSEFVKTLTSDPKKVPFDRYLGGDQSALTPQQVKGLELFKGKANCVACHNGPLLSDKGYHNTGVPTNPELKTNPQVQIAARLENMTIGVSGYDTITEDYGRYMYTKNKQDMKKFRTPSLREAKYTAPYMHNGTIATLEDVVEFYNAGGGNDANKDAVLKPLGLTTEEKAALVAFLNSLSSDTSPHADAQPAKYGEEGYPYQVLKINDGKPWTKKDPRP